MDLSMLDPLEEVSVGVNSCKFVLLIVRKLGKEVFRGWLLVFAGEPRCIMTVSKRRLTRRCYGLPDKWSDQIRQRLQNLEVGADGLPKLTISARQLTGFV